MQIYCSYITGILQISRKRISVNIDLQQYAIDNKKEINNNKFKYLNHQYLFETILRDSKAHTK